MESEYSVHTVPDILCYEACQGITQPLIDLPHAAINSTEAHVTLLQQGSLKQGIP